MYVTEFGYQTNPPDPFQTPVAKVPGFMNEAEWMAYRDERVRSWSHYLLIDDIVNVEGPEQDKFSRFQTGLRFEDGSAKPFVYDAYRLPIFVRLLSSSKVEVWGAARALPGASVRIEQRASDISPYEVPSGGEAVQTNVRGYFSKRFNLPDASRRTFRFSVQEGDKVRVSREARPVKR